MHRCILSLGLLLASLTVTHWLPIAKPPPPIFRRTFLQLDSSRPAAQQVWLGWLDETGREHESKMSWETYRNLQLNEE